MKIHRRGVPNLNPQQQGESHSEQRSAQLVETRTLRIGAKHQFRGLSGDAGVILAASEAYVYRVTLN